MWNSPTNDSSLLPRVTLILHGVLESLAPKLYAHVMCIYQKGVNKHMVINKHGLKQEHNWKVAMKVQDYGCTYIFIKMSKKKT